MFKDAPEKITARVILQIMGSPKDFVDKTLAAIIGDIQAKHKVVSEERFKAKEQGAMFNAFSELDMEFKTFEELVGFCFDYMPSSVEITDPLDFQLPAEDFTGWLNDMLARLHNMELERKASTAQSMVLNDKLSMLLRNMVIVSLRLKPKTAEELSKDTGISGPDIEPFLNNYCDEGLLVSDGEKYSVKRDDNERASEPG